jgi:hypothetical protein
MVIGNVDFGDLAEQGWISPAFSITTAPRREDIRRRLAQSGQQIQQDVAGNPVFAATRHVANSTNGPVR